MSLHLPGIRGIQKRRHWMVLLAMDPSPAPAASICLHQVSWLFLLLWHNKNRQQGQGHFAVPRVLLPWRAIYLGHDERQAKLKNSKAPAWAILCSYINIRIIDYPQLERTTRVTEVPLLALCRTSSRITLYALLYEILRMWCKEGLPNVFYKYQEGLHKESDRDITLNTSKRSWWI